MILDFLDEIKFEGKSLYRIIYNKDKKGGYACKESIIDETASISEDSFIVNSTIRKACVNNSIITDSYIFDTDVLDSNIKQSNITGVSVFVEQEIVRSIRKYPISIFGSSLKNMIVTGEFIEFTDSYLYDFSLDYDEVYIENANTNFITRLMLDDADYTFYNSDKNTLIISNGIYSISSKINASILSFIIMMKGYINLKPSSLVHIKNLTDIQKTFLKIYNKRN